MMHCLFHYRLCSMYAARTIHIDKYNFTWTRQINQTSSARKMSSNVYSGLHAWQDIHHVLRACVVCIRYRSR